MGLFRRNQKQDDRPKPPTTTSHEVSINLPFGVGGYKYTRTTHHDGGREPDADEASQQGGCPEPDDDVDDETLASEPEPDDDVDDDD